jgi:competence protein ComFC
MASPKSQVTKLLKHPCSKALLDLIFPRSCVHCDELVEGSMYDFICKNCDRELFKVKPPACTTCGHPFFGALAGPRICPKCCELDPKFDQGKTLFLAKGPGRTILHELKYNSGIYMLEDIRKIIADNPHYQSFIKNATLVPVPLHPTKFRERGYNQSEFIAQLLASASGGTSNVELILKRQRFTLTQTRLSRRDRHRNVKNAFALSSEGVIFPDNNYIVVDDVFTTGSTLNACCHVLRKAGVKHLSVVTLGHG